TNPVAPAAHVYANGPYAELNGVVYFNGESSIPGDELWRTDGTAQGTWLVKKVLPGDYRSPSWVDLTAFQGALYFVAAGPEGTELWRSDGTPEGTAVFKDIVPGAGSADVRELTVVGNSLYFTAALSPGGTRGLFKTDGTASGTLLVKSGFDPIELTAAVGKLFLT